MPEHRYDRQYENPEELCAGLEWMEDRGMVSREHTLRLSDHDGKVIADNLKFTELSISSLNVDGSKISSVAILETTAATF